MIQYPLVTSRHISYKTHQHYRIGDRHDTADES